MNGKPFCAVVFALVVAACSEQPTLVAFDEQGTQRLIDDIDGDRAMDYLAAIVAAHEADTPMDCSRFGDNAAEIPELCYLTRERALALMEAQLQALGCAVSRQRIDEDGFVTENLIAERPGTEAPDEVVMIAGHVDAFFAAADDNSSGAAAILELATALGSTPTRRTIRFVAFDLEETHHTGSTRYVEHLADRGRIAAVLNLDGLGWTSAHQASIPGLPVPAVGDFVAVEASSEASRLGLDLWALNERFGLTKVALVVVPGDGAYPMLDPLLHGDQVPFWLEGIPAVVLSDTGGLRREDIYHTANDAIAEIDRAFYVGTLRLAAAAMSYWAGGAP